jgi:SSS family solute:Na+ symporter
MKGGWLALVVHRYAGDMAQNFWTAIWSWSVCFSTTIFISLLTSESRTDEELRGLVYSLTARERHPGTSWYQQPATLAVAVVAAVIALNIIFW